MREKIQELPTICYLPIYLSNLKTLPAVCPPSILKIRTGYKFRLKNKQGSKASEEPAIISRWEGSFRKGLMYPSNFTLLPLPDWSTFKFCKPSNRSMAKDPSSSLLTDSTQANDFPSWTPISPTLAEGILSYRNMGNTNNHQISIQPLKFTRRSWNEE